MNEILPESSGIYALVFPNGRLYVGLSVNIRRRFAQHCAAMRRGADYPLYKAWRVLGDPECSVLELCPRWRLRERERHWIAEKDSRRSGYNSDSARTASKPQNATCSVERCGKPARRNGMCAAHAKRHRRRTPDFLS